MQLPVWGGGNCGDPPLPGVQSWGGKHFSQIEIGSYPLDCLSKWDRAYILFTFLQGKCSEHVINHFCSCWARPPAANPAKFTHTKPVLITAPALLTLLPALPTHPLALSSLSLSCSSFPCLLFLPLCCVQRVSLATPAPLLPLGADASAPAWLMPIGIQVTTTSWDPEVWILGPSGSSQAC